MVTHLRAMYALPALGAVNECYAARSSTGGLINRASVRRLAIVDAVSDITLPPGHRPGHATRRAPLLYNVDGPRMDKKLASWARLGFSVTATQG